MAYGSLSPSQGTADILAHKDRDERQLVWTVAAALIGIDISKDNRWENAALQEKLKAWEDN
ncbi:hypothetical protein APSETT444_007366 [Aspergillus pseudonomiae]